MDVWARVGLLAIGGALGTNARYWLGLWVSGWAGGRFPFATLVVNVSGSFAAGLLAGLLARALPHPYWRISILVGFLGGFTTFSALELESLDLFHRRGWGLAAANLLGSVAAGFLAVALGASLSRALAGPPAPADPHSRTSNRPD